MIFGLEKNRGRGKCFRGPVVLSAIVFVNVPPHPFHGAGPLEEFFGNPKQSDAGEEERYGYYPAKQDDVIYMHLGLLHFLGIIISRNEKLSNKTIGYR